MSRNTRWRYGDPIAYRSPHDALSRPDQSEREAPLAPGAALIVIGDGETSSHQVDG